MCKELTSCLKSFKPYSKDSSILQAILKCEKWLNAAKYYKLQTKLSEFVDLLTRTFQVTYILNSLCAIHPTVYALRMQIFIMGVTVSQRQEKLLHWCVNFLWHHSFVSWNIYGVGKENSLLPQGLINRFM